MPHLIQPKLWILVADAAQARVVTPDSHAGRFFTVFRFEGAAHPHEHRDEDRHRHAAAIAKRLSEEAQYNAYDQLVLIAPGHMLHDIRDNLSRKAEGRVVDTASLDLAAFHDHDLSEHLAKWWLVQVHPA